MKNIIYRMTKVTVHTFILISFCASAQMQDLHNVEAFEFHGVRLGMTAEQAQQGLVAFYSVDEKEVRVRRVKSHMPITDHQNAAYHVMYRADEHVVEVKLTPSLDAKDIGYMVVSSVSVKPGLSVDRDELASKFYTQTLEQFGPASYAKEYEAGYLSSAIWCTKPGTSRVKCDEETARFTITRNGVELKNPVYHKVWMSELESWAQTASDAGSLKYGSSVNNITTHACAFYDDGSLKDCKIGEVRETTVEVLDTTTPVKFDDFDRAKVYKVIDIEQSEIGDRIAITSYTRTKKGERQHLDIRTVGIFNYCELVAKNPETVTLKCENDTFDVKKEWILGLKNI